jgi:hypothetical protein
MSRVTIGFVALVASGFLVTSAAAAEQQAPMKATAPEKMMPSGAAEKMRECDKEAMQQNIKMEDRAQFVKDCVDKKMK